MTSHDGEMQPQRTPSGKSSLDDAFKSLEQLLHVLQEATSQPAEDDSELEAGIENPELGSPVTPVASGAARPSSLEASPSATSAAGGNDLDEASERTPSAEDVRRGLHDRPKKLSEFSELMQAAEQQLFSPDSCRMPPLLENSTTQTPLAWREDSSEMHRASSSSTAEGRSVEAPSSLPTEESGAGLFAATLRDSERAEVIRTLEGDLRPRPATPLGQLEPEELAAEQEDVFTPLPVFRTGKAAARKDASVQCDTTSEPMQRCEEELCRLSALVQAGSEELSGLKRSHADELEQMRALLGAREEELAALKARHCEQASAREGVPGQPSELQVTLREKEEEALRLASELHSTNFKLTRLQSQQEKELEDCAEFLRRLALSSSTPALGLAFDLGTAEVLGMGNYGYIFTCRSKGSGDRVVVKLQSARWAGVAVKEWAHGSQLSGHSHIVSYIEAIMHRDANMEIENHLKAGFDSGILNRRRPKFFPDCYFCLALEYMDRGTVQNFMDRHPLSAESVGAITRQVASALAFMHKRKRTHNDIKPENILLREAPRGDCLVAKLADLGLADHSSERTRDRDLFSYTVWCMGLGERFQRCPAAGGEREAAVVRLRKAAPSQKPEKDVWEALAKIVAEMWRGDLEMVEVEGAERLQGLKITLPDSREEAVDLEASAKLDLTRRINISWKAHRFRRRRSFQNLQDMHVDENGCKIADSEPEEELEGEEEEQQDGNAMAATWPPARR